jgi:hypothetical protein
MTLGQVRALTKSLATWLAATTSLLFAVSRFLPSGRLGGYSTVEDSWIQMLHMAFAERLQFGRDIVFTFGPWGFLFDGYHPATYLISVVVWVVLAVVFWWAAWRVVTHFFKNPLVSWLWMMVVIGLASISAYVLIDARLTAWPVLLLLLHFSVEERAFTLTQAMLVVSLALLSLIKSSIFTIAIVTVLIIAADNVFRQRRFPWIVLAFAGGIFFFWVLAGQGITRFGLYLRGASEIVSGYTEAMMLQQPTDKVDIIRFWEVAIAVFALVGYVLCKQHRLFGVLPLLGFAFIVFAAFKHGYVRHDMHEIPATNLLLLAALLWLPVAWFAGRCTTRESDAAASKSWPTTSKKRSMTEKNRSRTRQNISKTAARATTPSSKAWRTKPPGASRSKPISWRRWLVPAVLLPLIFATPLASLSLRRYYANNSLFSVLAQQLRAQNLFAPAKTFREFLEDRQHSFRAYNTYAAGLSAGKFPNLDIHGSADVYPLSQTVALPQGLTCRPRPIFQSYSAYTPNLAEMNAAHLRSDRAADHILFDVWTIDGRFPTQDDSLSWPELLTRYDIKRVAGRYILMTKSVTPRHYELTSIAETVANFDEGIEVPSMIGGPIWVRIDIQQSFYGNVVAMLYRPPRVSLTLFTRTGRTYSGRLLPAVARAGFLLSPLIENRQSFFSLASTNWQRELADLEVTSARITIDGGREVASQYKSPPVRARFYRLDFQRQDLSQTR